MFNSVVSMFVCVFGLIVEHQWSHNFDGSNLYEWLQYIEYEKKSAWKYLLFSIYGLIFGQQKKFRKP